MRVEYRFKMSGQVVLSFLSQHLLPDFLTKKKHTLNFYGTCYEKSHFLFTRHNECVFNMERGGEQRIGRGRERLEPVGGEVSTCPDLMQSMYPRLK